MDQHQRWLVTVAFIAVVNIETAQFDKPRAAVRMGVTILQARQRQRTKTQARDPGRQGRLQGSLSVRHASTSSTLLLL